MKKLKQLFVDALPFIILAVAFTVALTKEQYRGDQYKRELDSLKASHELLIRQYEVDQQFYQKQFDSLSLILQELTTRKALTELKITELKARIDAAAEDRKQHLIKWQRKEN